MFTVSSRSIWRTFTNGLIKQRRSSGRDPSQIRLVGVTKYVSAATAAELATLGLTDLGESRPQALWEKADAITEPSSILWHLVGSLQRNKIRRTLPLVHLIHSVDSLRLLEAIDRIAAEQQRIVDALMEVNVSGEANKQGLEPDQVSAVLDRAALLESVHVRGLMCMASLECGEAETHRQFASLRQLRDRLRSSAPDSIALHELSMGMSDDFEIAIAEGATIVRIGSILFEGMM